MPLINNPSLVPNFSSTQVLCGCRKMTFYIASVFIWRNSVSSIASECELHVCSDSFDQKWLYINLWHANGHIPSPRASMVVSGLPLQISGRVPAGQLIQQSPPSALEVLCLVSTLSLTEHALGSPNTHTSRLSLLSSSATSKKDKDGTWHKNIHLVPQWHTNTHRPPRKCTTRSAPERVYHYESPCCITPQEKYMALSQCISARGGSLRSVHHFILVWPVGCPFLHHTTPWETDPSVRTFSERKSILLTYSSLKFMSTCILSVQRCVMYGTCMRFTTQTAG